MNKIKNYLVQPSLLNNKPWIVVIIASLLVCFILLFFQPFGIENIKTPTKWFIIAGFTIVTAISTLISGYVLPNIFKRFYNHENWTAGKSLLNNLFIILLIALGNFIFDWSISDRQSDTFVPVLLAYLIATILVGVIPATVIAFVVQNNALKQNLGAAKQINKQLSEGSHSAKCDTCSDEGQLKISGNTRETITLYPRDILYIEVSGNYIKVNYLSDTRIKQGVLRATISQIEHDLQPFSFIVRCHRAFMVNISYITNIEGNSQGFQLTLDHTRNKIPVSRSSTKVIRDKFNDSLVSV